MSAADFVLVGNVLKKYTGQEADVVIPDGVTKIAEYAFNGCSHVTSVHIPAGVQVIGRHAFADCKKLSTVYVPEGVKFLEWGVFMGCESLKSVILPDSITAMEGGIFRRCRGLEEVRLPKGLKKIASETFWGCMSLAQVEIPDGVEEIGEQAFCGCRSFQKITIPLSVKRIGSSAFRSIRTLKSFTVFSEESFLMLWNALYEYRIYLLLSLVKEGKLFPAAITKIKPEKRHLSELIISEDDNEAMATLYSLFKKIDLDELDLAIEKSVEAPLVKAYLIEYKKKKYPPEKLERMARLKEEKELGLRPRSIADWKKIYTFRKCEGGVAISVCKEKGSVAEIPEKLGKNPVVRIDDMAFFASRNLTAVTIPDSVKTIGRGAFRACEGLADENGFVIIRGVLYGYHGADADVVVPEGVKCISCGAFSECASLVSVTLPDGVTKIEEEAFWDCPSLESVRIPDSVTDIRILAFAGCENLAIQAPAGSLAEQYAKKRQIPFVAE